LEEFEFKSKVCLGIQRRTRLVLENLAGARDLERSTMVFGRWAPEISLEREEAVTKISK
jgi:hypothetical protein